MKSFYYFLCGIMLTVTLTLFTVDHYGREFIQDYWISQLWYGDYKLLYENIQRIIIFIDLIFVYIAGIVWATGKKRKRKVCEKIDHE